MKFNPHTNRLFTDDNRLIKQLVCPYRANWMRFTATSDPKARLCDVCDHRVTDTALMTEDEVVALMAADADACLKVDFDQDSLTIKWTRYYPYHFPSTFAAYLIPADIEIGERVLLEDLIEDRIGQTWNQGDTYRLDSCEAVWDGSDLKLKYRADTHVARCVGQAAFVALLRLICRACDRLIAALDAILQQWLAAAPCALAASPPGRHHLSIHHTGLTNRNSSSSLLKMNDKFVS